MYTNTAKRKTLRAIFAFTLILTLLIPSLPALASVSVSVGDATPGKGVGVSWGSVSGVDHYEYSVRDLTSGDLIYNRKSTTRTSCSISGSYIVAGHSYRVWVGAIKSDGAEPTGEYQGTCTFTARACPHNDTRKVKDDTYNSWCRADKNGETHETCYVYDVVCRTCGETIKTGEIFESHDDHDFNSKGICRDCGYTEECTEHENTYESLRGQEGAATSISGTQHEITYLYYIICSGCGDTVDIERRNKAESHAFSGNTCSECGYVKDAPAHNPDPTLRPPVTQPPAEPEATPRIGTPSGTPAHNPDDPQWTITEETLPPRVTQPTAEPEATPRIGTPSGTPAHNPDDPQWTITEETLPPRVTQPTAEPEATPRIGTPSGTPAHNPDDPQWTITEETLPPRVTQPTAEPVATPRIGTPNGTPAHNPSNTDENVEESNTICRIHGKTHVFEKTDNWEAEHPHKMYRACDCGYANYLGKNKSFVSGCCECGDHTWGEAYQIKGTWKQKCVKCASTKSVSASEKSTKEQEKTTDPQEKTQEHVCEVYGVAHMWKPAYKTEHPHKGYLVCDCNAISEKNAMTILLRNKSLNCCECMGVFGKIENEQKGAKK